MRKGSSELLLLDVNALLALAWPNHQFHAKTTRRLGRGRPWWATCALTQLGFIRLSANPMVVGVEQTAADAAALLKDMISDDRHVYLDNVPEPGGDECLRLLKGLLGYRQVTDAYLVACATSADAKLLTFDTRLASLDTTGKRVEVLRF